MSHADQITASLDRFAAAWGTHDGAALGSHFTDDGTLVNPFGQVARGRGAVAAMYTEYFAGMLRGTTTSFAPATVRPVESRHALVDCQQTIRGADGGIVLVVHLAALLERHGESWRFVDARPFTYATPPSA